MGAGAAEGPPRAWGPPDAAPQLLKKFLLGTPSLKPWSLAPLHAGGTDWRSLATRTLLPFARRRAVAYRGCNFSLYRCTWQQGGCYWGIPLGPPAEEIDGVLTQKDKQTLRATREVLRQNWRENLKSFAVQIEVGGDFYCPPFVAVSSTHIYCQLCEITKDQTLQFLHPPWLEAAYASPVPRARLSSAAAGQSSAAAAAGTRYERLLRIAAAEEASAAKAFAATPFAAPPAAAAAPKGETSEEPLRVLHRASKRPLSSAAAPEAGGGPSAPSGRRRTLRRGPRVGALGALSEIDSLIRPTSLDLASLGASALPLSLASSKFNRNPYEHHALIVGAFCLASHAFYAARSGAPGSQPGTLGAQPDLLHGELYEGPQQGLHGERGAPFLGALHDATAADFRIGREALRVTEQREREALCPCLASFAGLGVLQRAAPDACAGGEKAARICSRELGRISAVVGVD
ncbi:uncharacterized protein LOC34624564 [Cyclospora cayetanensis]|uniref:Uncharacterized protein LOC34624564 n=1 Tax=Cyclospora cayetanensis TaxID=88456 RepID=A0A6P6RRH4_9EIME|nr:uncharacterized protein LOC34624564 [Cyclospora cayetanensis]